MSQSPATLTADELYERAESYRKPDIPLEPGKMRGEIEKARLSAGLPAIQEFVGAAKAGASTPSGPSPVAPRRPRSSGKNKTQSPRTSTHSVVSAGPPRVPASVSVTAQQVDTMSAASEHTAAQLEAAQENIETLRTELVELKVSHASLCAQVNKILNMLQADQGGKTGAPAVAGRSKRVVAASALLPPPSPPVATASGALPAPSASTPSSRQQPRAVVSAVVAPGLDNREI